MIRIAIVEDDINYVHTLQKYIDRYEKENSTRMLVTVFQDGEDIVTNYKADYDIILMDIEMKFMDGMTAAEEIRKVDTEVVIIFITNMPQYVMKGYEVEALDYVIKPINYYALSQRLERAIARMQHRKKAYISIAYHGGIKKLDASEISVIEVQNHDLIFHTTSENYTSRGVMKELEENLIKENFFRCSKSYLVNLEYVDSFEGNDAVVGNVVVQVSRSKKKEFMDALNDYINEVSK